MFDTRRKSLDPERATNLVIAQDYLTRRKNTELYRLCEKCPSQQNKSGGAKYKISCEKHNREGEESPRNTPSKKNESDVVETSKTQEAVTDVILL